MIAGRNATEERMDMRGGHDQMPSRKQSLPGNKNRSISLTDNIFQIFPIMVDEFIVGLGQHLAVHFGQIERWGFVSGGIRAHPSNCPVTSL